MSEQVERSRSADWHCQPRLGFALIVCAVLATGTTIAADVKEKEGTKRRSPRVLSIEEVVAGASRVNFRSYIFLEGEPARIVLIEDAKTGPRKAKAVAVPLDELNKHQDMTPAEVARPRHVAVIAGSFPIKKQVEEFRVKLGLHSSKAVFEENSTDDSRLPTFRFVGAKVQRREVDADKNPLGEFKNLEFTEFRDLLVLTGRRLDPEDTALSPVSFPGLVMRMPLSFQSSQQAASREAKNDGSAQVEKKLKLLAKSLEKLKRKPASDELPDHCLLRVIDVGVEPGKNYEYRLRVRITNPNHGRRDVVNPADAKEPELLSDWSKLPIIVRVGAES